MPTSIVVAAILPFLFINTDPLHARQVALGVKGGIRTTDDTNSSPPSESKRYIVGPMVDIQLPFHLGVEFDALYRPFGFTSSSGSCCASSITRERSNSWEFPIIGKYTLPGLWAHPFVGVGYAPRIVHGTDVSSGSFLSGETTNPPADVYTTYTNQ